ncbi:MULTISPECIES: pentapeptide repeat-containing protein [Neisseria]|uniref:pentapeptide repeat-containing protein n=1 Tax=Neisseria TaxID=482 RepID=UPI00163D90F7|nr:MULTISPECIES: pentapeptide repeat-containing protein [Neisseria]MDU4437494.1 pentapeptide repeat-containing protein [Neisseria sp.]
MDTAVSMLKDHQLWLSSGGKEGKQAVFTGYDLSGLDSDYAEARYVVPPFWEKDLSKIDLSYSNLSGLYFRDVNLSQADFRGANLKNTHFYWAILFDADFSGADISEANIEESSLVQANLTKADLFKTGITYSYLENANLQDANCQETNFRNTQLQGANLHGANFHSADFGGATIEENQLIHIRFAENIDFDIVKVENESLKNQISLFEDKIQLLQKGLEQTQSESNSRGNQEEIDKLQKQIKQIEEEKNQSLEDLKKSLKLQWRNQIQYARNSLAHALKNTDNQIKNNENTACWFKRLGIALFIITIILLLIFSIFVLCAPDSFLTQNFNILFYTFPIITLMLIGTTCLRHQKNLLGEVRHFSNMKHQIELCSGLLEASQHAAASFNNPEKADEYVQETFTQIRNRLLNSQYLPDNSSADKQSDNDFGSDKVLDLLNKIADLSGKKSMGN